MYEFSRYLAVARACEVNKFKLLLSGRVVNSWMTILSSEENTGKSDRRVMGTLTISHLAQHLFAGSSILYNNIMADLNLSYTQVGLMVGVVNVLGGFLQIFFSVASRWVSRKLLLTGSNLDLSLGCALTGRW